MTQAPRRGTEHTAVAIEGLWRSLREKHIDLAVDGSGGAIVYVMGDYGTGKTFLCNFIREQVWKLGAHGFATSYVAVPGFESLANFMGIYGLIVKNIQMPNSGEDLEGILLTFVNRFSDKASLNRRLRDLGIGGDFAQKIRYFWEYRDRDAARTITLRWIKGEPGIKAELLNYIDEKGFAKLEESDIDDYLTGLKRIVQDLGAEGLFVFIDEAEARTRPFDDKVVYPVLNNIKRLHNNVNQDEHYSKIIFLLAGTRALWATYLSKDEPQRQRMQIQEDIPRMSKADYVELGKRVAHVYDVALGSTVASRLNESLLAAWVDFASPGSLDRFTPRDFLSQRPTPREAFLSKLDQLRAQPSARAEDVFFTEKRSGEDPASRSPGS